MIRILSGGFWTVSYVDASSCAHMTGSVTKQIDGKKRVVRVRKEAKWVWLNVEEAALTAAAWPSQHKYQFMTAVGIGRLLSLHMLFVPVEHSANKAKCPLPSGFVEEACQPEWVDHCEKPDRLPETLKAGEGAFVIG
jgi:hypothetical protein